MESKETRSALPVETYRRRGTWSNPLNTATISMTRTNSSMSSTSLADSKLRKMSTSASPVVKEVWGIDKNTGERKDPTDMLHSLAHDFDAPGTGRTPILHSGKPPIPATEFILNLSTCLWQEASLSLSCKPFQTLCHPGILRQLKEPDNFRARCAFLYRLDSTYPDHLLCYICGVYHQRMRPGQESLRPTNIANPIFTCRHAFAIDPTPSVSKHRITFGRHISFPFIQLVLRHELHGKSHGIHYDSLSRRYKDRTDIGPWRHQTSWAVIGGHLYMRVVSSAFVIPDLPPAGKRHLLYSREDFVPFFSVCAHWRDGELMSACKCALDHVPVPLSGGGIERVGKEVLSRIQPAKSLLVSQCDVCKPMRRCPECPTEYLIEIRLTEDKMEKVISRRFRHAIAVTRWSDLGDGSSPWTLEWAAVNGHLDHLEESMRFNSFGESGRRAISGIFEGFFNPEQVPGARLLSLNPTGERLGERGHNWY
ncbi:hypothetical protein P154DRAFT_552234 [Amniculicola lignicola CBS 123094]|uniref:Uncharacterized protein n=1 Tax=Amniculicola lignicola CBS 123094 TaxID=1392246 RepID=A0A6A5WYB5_9PLEO|nr:hypothetical protein P154DRAFT_552234 [Amniculicola lignicola CBS 123094]